MIKIEAIDGVCSIVRGEEECALFVGMIIEPEEVSTIKGNVTYSVDESELVTTGGSSPVEEPAAKIAS